MKNGMILYYSYQEQFDLLTDAEIGQLVKALLEYDKSGIVPQLSGMLKMAFSFIKANLDRDKEKYDSICERNRENGLKGGRPKKVSANNDTPNKPKETERFSEKPKKADIDKDIDIEIDIDKDIEIDNIKYQLFADMYNEICISFPHVTKLSEARKKSIKARINSGYKIEDFKKLFTLAEQNAFLKGGNDRNWQASFDWLIKDSNMAKVLDGNYSKGTTKSGKASQNFTDTSRYLNDGWG